MSKFVVRSVDDPAETFGEFATGADAAVLARELKESGRRVRIVREDDAPADTVIMYGFQWPQWIWRDEDAGETWEQWAERNPGHAYHAARVPADGVSWRLRESGHRGIRDVPWIDEPWWKESPHWQMHFPHPSTADRARIAYTPSEEHGREDRQVRTRPGRYLAQHFADVLSSDEIQRWALAWATQFAPVELEYARTPDEIEYVYTHGPSSCMAHSAAAYSSHCHPVRVYGAGDLAVAYIRNGDGEISGRALCYPDNGEHGRVYGDIERMRDALDRAGFVPGMMAGARVLKIEDSGGYVLPFFDSGAVRVDGDYFVICDHAEASIYPETTHGIAPDNRVYCEMCEDYCDEDDAMCDPRGDTICRDCYDAHCAYCYECDSTIWADDSRIGPDGETRCNDCHAEYVDTCGECGDDVMRDDCHTGPDDETRCEDCHSAAVGECDDCGDDVMRDDLHTGPDDCERCEYCHSEWVRDEYDDNDDDDDGAPAPVRRPRARARARPDMSHPEQVVAALAPVIQGCARCGGARPLGWSVCRDCSRVLNGWLAQWAERYGAA